METTTILILSVALLVILQKLLGLQKILRAVQSRPGFRTVFSITGVTSFFPPIPLLSVGNTAFEDKYKMFEKYDADIFTAISLLPSPEANFVVSDPQAIKEIVGSRVHFPKPVQLYSSLLVFGSNIVASEHEEWKKYRKISGPAFTEPNNRLVWDETVSVMNDLFKNIWGDKRQIVLDHTLEITMPIALFVIGAAGFGRRLTWNDELKAPQGHTMTFKDALYTVSEGIRIKLMVPKWAGAISSRVKKAHEAFDELEKYMLEMIESRKNTETKEERYDLFSSLLDANDGNADDVKLSDPELLGNIFIFLIAGHETTAHTLCFALGLLALHPDEQERIYQEVLKAIPEDRDPTIQDLPAFNYIDCVLNEVLRMFPPVIGIPKEAAEDCTLSTTNGAGEKVTVAIPKGAGINLDTVGLHYNPKYWDDPLTFKPSRFQGDWPRDAFLPFSGGVRSCLGRRFAELESIVAIAMLIKHYKITVKQEPRFSEETFEKRKARLLQAKNGLTLTPVRTPLVFTRRN